jgi:hypothetical protein
VLIIMPSSLTRGHYVVHVSRTNCSTDISGHTIRMVAALTEAEYSDLSQVYAQRLADQEQDHPGYTQSFELLTQRLCSARQLVVPPLVPEPHLGTLLAKGKLREAPVTRLPLEPNQCHANSATAFVSGRADAIATGYALAPDGLWRQHTVGWDGSIIETTVPFSMYYMVVLTLKESWMFASGELSAHATTQLATPTRLSELENVLSDLRASSDLPEPQCTQPTNLAQ